MSISDNGPNTLPADRERVQRQIKMQIAYYTRHPELIGIRLRQLDREWDIERIIERKTAALAVVGTTASNMRNYRWLALPARLTRLLHNTVQEWGPPVRTIRKLGYRTRDEIEQERQELMTLRDRQAARPKRKQTTRRRRPSVAKRA
jgi:hypothetical protein